MATEMPTTDRCNGPHEGARLCGCGWRPGYGVWEADDLVATSDPSNLDQPGEGESNG